jgi:2'-5' RNA ligase
MPRLFVAINLPDETKSRLKPLLSGLPGASWSDPESLHLTLRFIGDVDGADSEDIIEALSEIEFGSFELELAGLGHFPLRGAPKQIWIGAEHSDSLLRLQNKIDRALIELGFEPERRKFFPHVTLARLSGTPLGRVADYLSYNADIQLTPFTVNAFQLYSSELLAAGAYHEIVADYRLN